MTTKNARALQAAHALYKNLQSPISNHQWSGIVKYAWYFERLRTWMSTDIVSFSYWKKDGTIREARGTLNQSLIPEEKRPGTSSRQTGWRSQLTFGFERQEQRGASLQPDMASAEKGKKPNNLCFPYFDLDKQEWRSFSLDNFIGFVSIGGHV